MLLRITPVVGLTNSHYTASNDIKINTELNATDTERNDHGGI
jgi:hypothetical protein